MDLGTVQRVDIEEKMRSAYLSYAMSVITARALPDVRDGLKPVQRRILYAMHDMGIRHDRPTRKSARIVGEVLGKYHPHGDQAVYDAMVRLAQHFSMRYPLVDGQGNFGSVDGDSAAAQRYTEARLSSIGEELLVDLDKDTVDFIDNFDGSLQEPSVLPSKLPNLLVNGISGIAVGMATNIPPHNLGEICDAIAYLIDNYEREDDVTVDDLLRYVKGPDFPTGGTILGMEGVRHAYATGKGRVIVRALAHIEEMRGGRSAIIVTELPYQVNKATLVERIAALVRDDRVQGIGDLRDESDRTGMRIVIVLKRGVEPGPVMEPLLKYTQMQTTFGVNMLSLVAGEPRLLPLKRMLLHHIEHRHIVIERRANHELKRALARAHILEGLLIAMDNLDEVIATIRRSRTAETARTNLIKRFKLSEVQAQAILDMQLRRLAALERRRIQEEHKEVTQRIAYLRDLLASKDKLLGLVKQDIQELKSKYGDARRTRILGDEATADLSTDDLVPNENVTIVLTGKGRVRRLPENAFSSRRTAVPGLSASERDVLAQVFVANCQETLYCFTQTGRAVGLPAHQFPDAVQQKGGLPLSNLVGLTNDELPITILRVPENTEGILVCVATRSGRIKRLVLEELQGVGRVPTTTIGLSENDQVISVCLASEDAELVLVTAMGRAIRFVASGVRPQGRSASGMRGISLQDDDYAVAMDVVQDGADLLVISEAGYAKKSRLSEYSRQGRGGQGVLTMDVAKVKDTGPLVDACIVTAEDELVVATEHGSMERMRAQDVARVRRGSWGRLVTRTRANAVVKTNGDKVRAIVKLVGLAGGARASSKRNGETRSAPKSAAKVAATGPKSKPEQAEKDAGNARPTATDGDSKNAKEPKSAAGSGARARRRRSSVTRKPPRRSRKKSE